MILGLCLQNCFLPFDASQLPIVQISPLWCVIPERWLHIPHFTRPPTALELYELYTPTEEELAFAARVTRYPEHYLHVLVLLKVFQRLGYVPDLADIPTDIILHLQSIAGADPDGILPTIDGGTRRKHARAVRHHLGVWRANQAVRDRMERGLKRSVPRFVAANGSAVFV